MANLKTNAQLSNFNTESVVITRKGAFSGGGFSTTTVYSGACDFQSEGGSPFYNPSGAVDVSDAVLYLDATVEANPGDAATVTQNAVAEAFTVVNVSLFTFPLTRTEIKLKRGPLEWQGRGR